MKINTCKEVYAAKIRYPHTAPFKYMLFDNEQAAIDFKEWWASMANKRCVGAIKVLYLNDIIPDGIKVYSNKSDAAKSMLTALRTKYNTNQEE